MKKVYDIDYDFGEYKYDIIDRKKYIPVYYKDLNIGYITAIISTNIHHDDSKCCYKAEVKFEKEEYTILYKDLLSSTIRLFPIAIIDKVNKKIDIEKFIFK